MSHGRATHWLSLSAHRTTGWRKGVAIHAGQQAFEAIYGSELVCWRRRLGMWHELRATMRIADTASGTTYTQASGRCGAKIKTRTARDNQCDKFGTRARADDEPTTRPVETTVNSQHGRIIET